MSGGRPARFVAGAGLDRAALASAFARDGCVVVEDALSPSALASARAECDAVTRAYARLGGHADPTERARGGDASRPASASPSASPSASASASASGSDSDSGGEDASWLAEQLGCVLEVPSRSCACCPRDDPAARDARSMRYRGAACAVARAEMRDALRADGAIGSLAIDLLRCRASDARLFNDQYIVKPPADPRRLERGTRPEKSAFPWHADSQWMDASDHATRRPYLSMWTALDDATEANGAVRVWPYPSGSASPGESPVVVSPGVVSPGVSVAPSPGTAGTPSSPKLAARVGAASYPVAADALNAAGTPCPRGSVLVELRAGSVLAMSDAVYHRSGPNVSERARRAWMPQFSDGDVLAKKKKEGGERGWEWGPVALAAPIDT